MSAPKADKRDDIDPVIHQPVRLRVVATLAAMESDAAVEFTYLRDLLGLTDGNLGAHLRKLEQASYVRQTKGFVQRKPRTDISLTTRGRHAFERHVQALERIIGR